MLYAAYIYPPEKKVKEKEIEEVVEEVKTKTSKLKKHFGSAPEASDLSTEEKLARAEAHLIELNHKIDRLTNENIALQNYLDERPELYYDTAKVCCLDQNEDLYNWTRIYDKLITDFHKMPSVLKEKEDILNNLNQQHEELITEYEYYILLYPRFRTFDQKRENDVENQLLSLHENWNLEERERLTKHLKERAVICNKELEDEAKKVTNMQSKLSWMEDYHKIQISGEVAILRREQEKQKFSINFYKKLCEKLEENESIPADLEEI